MFEVMTTNDHLLVKDNEEGLKQVQTSNYGLLFSHSIEFDKCQYRMACFVVVCSLFDGVDIIGVLYRT